MQWTNLRSTTSSTISTTPQEQRWIFRSGHRRGSPPLTEHPLLSHTTGLHHPQHSLEIAATNVNGREMSASRHHVTENEECTPRGIFKMTVSGGESQGGHLGYRLVHPLLHRPLPMLAEMAVAKAMISQRGPPPTPPPPLSLQEPVLGALIRPCHLAWGSWPGL